MFLFPRRLDSLGVIPQRRGGDSNPRGLAPCRFSRPVQSAALPPLRVSELSGKLAVSSRDSWTSAAEVFPLLSPPASIEIVESRSERPMPADPDRLAYCIHGFFSPWNHPENPVNPVNSPLRGIFRDFRDFQDGSKISGLTSY